MENTTFHHSNLNLVLHTCIFSSLVSIWRENFYGVGSGHLTRVRLAFCFFSLFAHFVIPTAIFSFELLACARITWLTEIRPNEETALIEREDRVIWETSVTGFGNQGWVLVWKVWPCVWCLVGIWVFCVFVYLHFVSNFASTLFSLQYFVSVSHTLILFVDCFGESFLSCKCSLFAPNTICRWGRLGLFLYDMFV